MARNVTIVAGICMIAGQAAGQNLLVNPGFETGDLDPWFPNAGAPFVSDDEAHTGSFSAAALGSDSIRQNFDPIPASDITEVSLWVKRAGGPFNSFTFYYDDGSSENGLINAVGDGDDWMFFDITGELNPDKNLSGFSIFGTGPGPAFLDDFTITPAPSSAALLALGGLAATRRRR